MKPTTKKCNGPRATPKCESCGTTVAEDARFCGPCSPRILFQKHPTTVAFTRDGKARVRAHELRFDHHQFQRIYARNAC